MPCFWQIMENDSSQISCQIWCRANVIFAGINRAGSCYLFSHATATTMLDNGADLRHLQEMLGHADISTTEIYAHVSCSKLAEVYGKSHPSALSEQRLF